MSYHHQKKIQITIQTFQALQVLVMAAADQMLAVDQKDQDNLAQIHQMMEQTKMKA